MFEEVVSAFYFILPLYLMNALILVLWRKKIITNFMINKEVFGIGRYWDGIFLIIFGVCLLYYIFFNSWQLGLVMGSGMAFGVLSSSFIKRRIGLKSGSPFPILDQLDFVLGSGLFYLLFFGTLYEGFFIICLLTLIFHPLSNLLAYKLGLKDVWW